MYRKFKADQIFTGYEFLPGNKVLITSGAGEIVDVVDEGDAGDNVEIFQGILSPGFINCHCHLELSHLKGFIPKRTGLVDFVFKIVTERHFEEAEILSAISSAEEEMTRNGIVAVGDICNNSLTIAQKIKGNLWYRNFIETSGFPPSVAVQRFQRSVDFYNSYAACLQNNSIVPHAPYSVSPELFQMINDFPGNDILSIHNQEITDENLLFENRQGDLLRMFEKMNIDISFFKPPGKTSLQTYLPYLNKLQSLILVHNVDTSKEDIMFSNSQFRTYNSQLFYCLCPNANLYISNLLPDINKFVEHDCSIVLGTDSLASNDQLSILDEMKTINQHFPVIELGKLFQWATINGARALGCDEIYGSFEKGKKPGIIQVRGVNGNNINDAEEKRII
ncbi:MAG: amidohydrolase family protein [Ferruginibacter sp.]